MYDGIASVMCSGRIRSQAGAFCYNDLHLQRPEKGEPLVSRTKLVVLTALLGWMVCSSDMRAAITVDGNLSDWGITLNHNRHLVYDAGYNYSYNSQQTVEKRGQTTYGGCTIVYDVEDSNDSAGHNAKVGPLYGGQDYDAEVLVVSVVGSDLYIGVSTGQRPDNGSAFFAPGDIRITSGNEVWGIEVGGGSHATSSTKVVDGDKGTTYTLASNGNTTHSTQLPNQKAGSIWEGGTWDPGIAGSGDVATQLNTGGVNGGTYLGMSDYVYNFDSVYGQHAFIELCIPNYAELFGDNLSGATIRWAPVCGNDQLSLCVIIPDIPSSGPVPEPASAMIWAVLLLTTLCVTRKRLSLFRRP
jgi:hypothetical protein